MKNGQLSNCEGALKNECGVDVLARTDKGGLHGRVDQPALAILGLDGAAIPVVKQCRPAPCRLSPTVWPFERALSLSAVGLESTIHETACDSVRRLGCLFRRVRGRRSASVQLLQ
ncbi:hypothetical protein C8D92_101338 [Tamilnaduibacter salinus]|uniref:Uncharacterized protein n=1 Tax=Tamilnaduibacter salinus TaxID=1484056 RepID=A0A2U1D176_9GAMM|nr:hypothetical protein C8D92_101338 [Tamilnaduibacter salinus]